MGWFLFSREEREILGRFSKFFFFFVSVRVCLAGEQLEDMLGWHGYREVPILSNNLQSEY